MAYGLKWYNEFTTVDGDAVRVEIHQRDYVGPSTEVKRAGSMPVVISLAEDATSNPFDPIRPTRASVEWISDIDSNFDIQNLFITDDQEFELFVKINGSVVWAGFVIHSDCQEPYLDRPYPVQFQATCGLAFLDRYTVLDSNGKYLYGANYIKTAITGVLSKIGHGFDIEDCTNLTNPYSVLVVNYRSFINNVIIDGDGTRDMTCMEFLAGVLNAANSFIVQSNGKWVIQSVRVLTEGQFDRVLFDSGYNYKLDGKISKTVEIIDPETDQSIKYPSQKLRPTPSVIEKLAQPKSKIRINVRPGVQVNRLYNGSFVPDGGTIPGWTIIDITPHGSYSVIGDGTPESPYILYYENFNGGEIGVVQTINSDIIELDIDEFGDKDTEQHNICIRFTGSFRAQNRSGIKMLIRNNYGERDWVDYLTQDGTWDQRKPNKNGEIRFIASCPVKKGTYTYDELEDNFFNFESKPIVNWIKRDGSWLARIELQINEIWPHVLPGQQASIWLRDFAITIDTGTPYEGDHSYEIDATKVILNGEEYSYDVTVADKINIETLEQKRPLNRVMTGYMTLAQIPTNDWVRIVDGDPDPLDSTPLPIQYLSLKERIRLLCGKRSVLEGLFYGKDLWPDSRINNEIETGRKPMMVTSWEWDVKNHQYKASFLELDFTPLPNEEIQLVTDETDGTGRKVRSGGSSTGNNSLQSQIGKPIKIDDFPILYCTKGRPVEYEQDVADYIISSQDIETLGLRLLSKPSWTIVEIDELTINITGTPEDAGEDQVLIEVSDGSGDEYIISIPVQVFPVTTATYTLTPGGKITPGLPKQIAHDPPYSLAIRVEGGHDRYQWEVKGPGLNDTSGPTAVSYTEDATYTPFSGENLAKGIYTFSIVTWRDIATVDDEDPVWTEVHRSTSVVIIGENIGDDDPDETIKVTLEPVGAELTGAGTAVEYLEEWNIALAPIGIIHDELFISIMPEQDPFMAELHPTTTNVGSAGDNEELDPIDGTGTPNADWYVTELTGVTEGERYWSDGEFFCYYSNGDFVSHHSEGELIVPAGVTEIKVNKKDSQPGLMLVEFEDYTLFPADTAKPAGAYSGFIRAFIAGTQVYEKYVKWTIQEPAVEEPEAEGGLILIEPGSVFSTIANLPLSGGVYPLPSGWNVLCPDFGGVEFDRVDWILEQDLGGWSEIDIPRFTGRDSVKTFALGPGGAGEVTANAYLFWTKSSTDIGSIHTAPSRFRATFNAWFEGVKVATRQADFLFREAGPLGDPSNLNLGWKIPEDSSIFVDKINIPQTGGYYPIDESSVAIGRKWVIYPKEYGLDGVTEFITTKVFVQGFLVATVENSGGLPQPTIGALFSEYLDWGELDGEGNRIVGGTNIDLPGQYHVKYEFWDESTLVGTLEAELFLYEPNPKIKDPSYCCKPGSGAGETHEIYFPASDTWVWEHGFSFKPIFRVVINGQEWDTAVTHELGKTTIYWNRPRAGYIVFED